MRNNTNYIYFEITNLSKYIKKYRNHITDHAKEIIENNMNADIIGFLFSERDDNLRKKMISTILTLTSNTFQYINEKELMLITLPIDGKILYEGVSFPRDKYESFSMYELSDVGDVPQKRVRSRYLDYDDIITWFDQVSYDYLYRVSINGDEERIDSVSEAKDFLSDMKINFVRISNNIRTKTESSMNMSISFTDLLFFIEFCIDIVTIIDSMTYTEG